MLSLFVSEKEAFGTKTGLPNTPTKEQYAAMKKVATEYFDPLRKRVGQPLYITSMFRSKAVNTAVRGAKNSDHQVLKDSKGFYTVAIDIDQDGRKTRIGNRALFFEIMHGADFYKAIWEFGNTSSPNWVHVSVSTDPAKNKLRRVYRAVTQGNRTVYLNFTTSGIK